jgi:phosphoribosylformimino-5-aminoimidazole carboxamide ribonucleotide (ProFAR) isomerase
VGGVASGAGAAELLLAGADAVQVGTATFRDPAAPWKVLRELARWCDRRGISIEALRAGRRQAVSGTSTTSSDAVTSTTTATETERSRR